MDWIGGIKVYESDLVPEGKIFLLNSNGVDPVCFGQVNNVEVSFSIKMAEVEKLWREGLKEEEKKECEDYFELLEDFLQV